MDGNHCIFLGVEVDVGSRVFPENSIEEANPQIIPNSGDFSKETVLNIFPNIGPYE